MHNKKVRRSDPRKRWNHHSTCLHEWADHLYGSYGIVIQVCSKCKAKKPRA